MPSEAIKRCYWFAVVGNNDRFPARRQLNPLTSVAFQLFNADLFHRVILQCGRVCSQ